MLESTPRQISITRRNLMAAVSIAVIAAQTRIASAARPDNPGKGHAFGHEKGKRLHCFLRGTKILTPQGEREVSLLSPGEHIITHSGRSKPIKWIGHRLFPRPATGWPLEVIPIKIARSALAHNVPHADLYVSRAHAIFVDGLLIPVGSLTNGSTIVAADADSSEVFEYFHVQLSDHDVILANGAPTETLLPSADHAHFDNTFYASHSEAQSSLTVLAMTGRQQLRSRLRSALSPIVDFRSPFDKTRDRLEERGHWMGVAA